MLTLQKIEDFDHAVRSNAGRKMLEDFASLYFKDIESKKGPVMIKAWNFGRDLLSLSGVHVAGKWSASAPFQMKGPVTKETWRGAYERGRHTIYLLDIEDYHNSADFIRTALHELGHSVRTKNLVSVGSYEEVVAELFAMLLGERLGLLHSAHGEFYTSLLLIFRDQAGSFMSLRAAWAEAHKRLERYFQIPGVEDYVQRHREEMRRMACDPEYDLDVFSAKRTWGTTYQTGRVPMGLSEEGAEANSVWDEIAKGAVAFGKRPEQAMA